MPAPRLPPAGCFPPLSLVLEDALLFAILFLHILRSSQSGISVQRRGRAHEASSASLLVGEDQLRSMRPSSTVGTPTSAPSPLCELDAEAPRASITDATHPRI